MLNGRENVRKGKKNHLTLPGLKKRIDFFNLLHGEVVFPAHFDYTFSRGVQAPSREGLRVLAFDPGTANFGCFGGVLYGVKTLHSIKPIVTKMLENPVTSLTTDLATQTDRFRLEICGLIEQVQPDIIIIERFQSRGLMGTTVELISFMIGFITGIANEYESAGDTLILVRPITASQWKNSVNKSASLEDLYAMLGKATLHHRLDAMLMSLYAFPDTNVYQFLTASKQRSIANYILESG